MHMLLLHPRRFSHLRPQMLESKTGSMTYFLINLSHNYLATWGRSEHWKHWNILRWSEYVWICIIMLDDDNQHCLNDVFSWFRVWSPPLIPIYTHYSAHCQHLHKHNWCSHSENKSNFDIWVKSFLQLKLQLQYAFYLKEEQWANLWLKKTSAVPNCMKHQRGEDTDDNRRQKAMWKSSFPDLTCQTRLWGLGLSASRYDTSPGSPSSGNSLKQKSWRSVIISYSSYAARQAAVWMTAGLDINCNTRVILQSSCLKSCFDYKVWWEV